MGLRRTEDGIDRAASLEAVMKRLRSEKRQFPGEFRNSFHSSGLTAPFIFVFVLIVMSLPFWEQVSRYLESSTPPLAPSPIKLPLQAFGFVVVYAFALAMSTIKALYKIRLRWADVFLQSVWPMPKQGLAARQIVFSAMASYALSIWAFALAYYYIFHAHLEPAPFSVPSNEGFFTWVYFSIVTMATVGFGEITPQTDWARALVSAEIIIGVAYQIFFFSIVASLIRERAGP